MLRGKEQWHSGGQNEAQCPWLIVPHSDKCLWRLCFHGYSYMMGRIFMRADNVPTTFDILIVSAGQ